ncbi:hypothetical protein ON010_g14256 [Phytophthora cinnamomi]|nr:hypothetical protein ON010_g14256 [Phytophthora cinnamomi]
MGSFARSTASTQATSENMARGRQQGYQNYSAKEELLICDLAAKLLPTGRNMWMALAADYNGSKDPNWHERDFD